MREFSEESIRKLRRTLPGAVGVVSPMKVKIIVSVAVSVINPVKHRRTLSNAVGVV